MMQQLTLFDIPVTLPVELFPSAAPHRPLMAVLGRMAFSVTNTPPNRSIDAAWMSRRLRPSTAQG